MAEREFYSGKILYPTIVALAALSVLFGFAILPRIFPSPTLVGHPAPDFALGVISNGSSGDRLELHDLKGQAVILDFWATWCEPCQIVAPILDRVARKHQGKGLVIIGVNTSDQPGLAPQFVKKKGLSYPIVYDDGDEVARRYGVTNLPTLVVIDARGNVVAIRTGIEDESSIEELVAQAMM
ncbi:MAG TPA: TlpA disulfide reductase family protein [Polyangiaceae bacterium]|nr:TlpA disulfide reductase family protein [Polyangiaceae bacterium]